MTARSTAPMSSFRPTRRGLLLGAGGFAAWAGLPFPVVAAGRDPRLVVVILRGGLDGLAAVPPIGDPSFQELRGRFGPGLADQPATLPLDGTFALHPALARLHQRFLRKEATIVHAVASPYRGRSHFDGQDVLESGLGGPAKGDVTGWLNRLAVALPSNRGVAPRADLVAVSATVPVILRGTAPVVTWMPQEFAAAPSDTAMRLLDLYGDRAPDLRRALREGLRIDTMMGVRKDEKRKGTAARFAEIAEGAARIMSEPEGPRLGVISFNGWDTHADEGAGHGRLAETLAALDGALDTLAAGLAPIWSQTVVLVCTEFGRTVRVNGTRGTDHGTATVAFLVGGAVKGGRMVADWPGLTPERLHEGRDLMPTTDLRAITKGLVRDHFGVGSSVLDREIHPDSGSARPIDGLIT